LDNQLKYILEKTHDHLDERQFNLAIRRLADSLSYGSDSSPFLGAGIDYVQSRQYQEGDPVKFIDWRVTARTGKFFVKEFEAPKQMPLYILMDTSASMCVSSLPISKYAWAVQLAGGIAMAALNRMSPVGVLGCGERELHVRPTLSRTTIYQWSHHLRHFNINESTTLGESIRTLTPSLKSRCMILVMSDLHDPDAIPALKLLAQKHDCVVLQLQDPAEKGRMGGGIFRAEEAETGKRFIAHGYSTWFTGEDAVKELKRSGIDSLQLVTNEHFIPRLRDFLKKRNCLGRGAR
jgi:uncharacterized protein (DUF58 family)